MKRACLFFSLLFSTVFLMPLSAQEHGKLRVGPTLGLDVSTTNLIVNHGPVLGLNAGALVDIGLGKHFYLGTGLKFAQRGVRWTTEKRYCNPGYIVLPLSAGYSLKISENACFFAELGVYGGYGVTGKLKTDSGTSISYRDAVFKESNTRPNRFEFGATGAIGIELLNSLQLRLGYEQGLTRLTPASGSAPAFRTISLGVAYLFDFIK